MVLCEDAGCLIFTVLLLFFYYFYDTLGDLTRCPELLFFMFSMQVYPWIMVFCVRDFTFHVHDEYAIHLSIYIHLIF